MSDLNLRVPEMRLLLSDIANIWLFLSVNVFKTSAYCSWVSVFFNVIHSPADLANLFRACYYGVSEIDVVDLWISVRLLDYWTISLRS